MTIKSKIQDIDEWLFMEEIPDVYAPKTAIQEKRAQIETMSAKIANFQLTSTGFFLFYSDMRFEKPVDIYTEVSGEAVASQFIFYRTIAASYGRSRHNIRYFPSIREEYGLQAGMEYGYFLMVLSKDFYFNLVNRHSSLHEDFVGEMEKGDYVSFKPKDMVVTPEMQKIITELKDSNKTGELRRLHTEAKVLELLTCQLEQFQEKEEPDAAWVLKSADVEKLEQARTILEANFANPPTQKELARQVALNESKLRKGFKKYFATTIHDYTVRIKMERARRLLLEEKKSIVEVAELTGFTHQNNFSAAFKKYFGISPSEVRVG